MAENMATRLQSEAFAKTGIEHTRIEQVRKHTFRAHGIRKDQVSDVWDQIENAWHSQVLVWTTGSKPHLLDVTYGGRCV